MLGRRPRVVRRCCSVCSWRISPTDFDAINVSDETVVILRAQRQPVELTRIADGKRNAQIRRGIYAKHRRFNVGLDAWTELVRVDRQITDASIANELETRVPGCVRCTLL